MMAEPIRALRLGAFASPAFTIAALGLPISIFLPPLYAELGISLTVIGMVFAGDAGDRQSLPPHRFWVQVSISLSFPANLRPR